MCVGRQQKQIAGGEEEEEVWYSNKGQKPEKLLVLEIVSLNRKDRLI